MALIGHISGSSQSSSFIGISGSVIIANQPSSAFPSAVSLGPDVSFFVSGAIGGKGGSTRNVSVFGGDAVVSGSLTIGTGSIKLTSNDIQFGTIANRIELAGSNLRFFDASNPSGLTLSSLATASPGGSTTQVQFNDGGTLNGSDGLTFNKATRALSANTISVTGSSGIAVLGTATFSSITGSSTITLSGQALLNGGLSTTTAAVSSNASVGGTLGVTGNITAAGTNNQINALSVTGSSGLSVISNATIGGNLSVTGDLTVNGTTTTINTNNLEVKDAVIGLGFASGTVGQSGNDRGLILGLGNSPHAAFLWKHTDSEFAVGATAASATGSLPVTLSSYSNFHANDIQGRIISASLGFSGSLTKLMDGTSYLVAGTNMVITTGSNGAVTISSTGGTGDITSVVAGTGLIGGATSGDATLAINDSIVATVSGTTFTGATSHAAGLSTTTFVATGLAAFSGSVDLGDAITDTVSFVGRVDTDVLPLVDNSYTLGSSDRRWAHVYTGDLHLRNDRGDYTLIEEEEFLSIRFNKTGKRYKFVLEAVPELDEDPIVR